MKQQSTSERSVQNKDIVLRVNYLAVYHQIMLQMLSKLIDLQDDYHDTGHNSSVFVHKKGLAHLHFKVCFVIGDTESHDVLYFYYMGYSKRVQRPV